MECDRPVNEGTCDGTTFSVYDYDENQVPNVWQCDTCGILRSEA